jgi:hypothetical protein
MPKNES